MEGHQATGESAPAQFLGTFEAASLSDACEMWVALKNHRKDYFNKDRLTFWGCKLYEAK